MTKSFRPLFAINFSKIFLCGPSPAIAKWRFFLVFTNASIASSKTWIPLRGWSSATVSPRSVSLLLWSSFLNESVCDFHQVRSIPLWITVILSANFG